MYTARVRKVTSKILDKTGLLAPRKKWISKGDETKKLNLSLMREIAWSNSRPIPVNESAAGILTNFHVRVHIDNGERRHAPGVCSTESTLFAIARHPFSIDLTSEHTPETSEAN